MEMAAHPRARRRLYVAVVAVSGLIGALCAGFNSGIGPFPPNGGSGGLQIATAETHVLVDAPRESILFRRRDLSYAVQTGVKHAEMLGRVMVTRPVLDRVAQRCEVPESEISGLGWMTANVPLALTEPDSERRASEIVGSRAPYRLEVQSMPIAPPKGAAAPIIAIYAQAPSTAEAVCLANASTASLSDYMRDLARRQGTSPAKLIRLRQLEEPRAGVVNGSASLAIAGLTFLVAFGLTAGALFGLIGLRGRVRASGPTGHETTGGDLNGTANGGRPRPGWIERLRAPQSALEPSGADDDNWPRTSRLLPWTLALFIAVVWLVPFNSLELAASLPIDLTLDRLVLPVVAIAWALALIGRARNVPWLGLTWIHVALGAFLGCALLSVVLDAHYLNQTLELSLSLKKLPLIVSYVAVFALTASAVRRREVPAFLTYTLLLAVICALGMIYEYRYSQNLFWNLTDNLSPGLFTFSGQVDGGALDSMGRRLVRGPAEVPLEAVAMLTLALPIALVRFADARRWGMRILYALAACLLMAAIFSTYRKGAIVAPAAAVLALVYFRRQALLRFAPLGMIVVVTVMVLSPGAVGSVVDQFTRSDAEALPTVSDRAADYDAIRPDVWTDLAFGRGWGSYNHESYRILDSEILQRTIETGVLGLLAFLLVPLAVLATTRRAIASRDPTSASMGLVGAAIAVAFAVLAFLFDVLAFPHVPYVFLYMTGLVAVVVAADRRREAQLVAPLYRPACGAAARAAAARRGRAASVAALKLSGRTESGA